MRLFFVKKTVKLGIKSVWMHKLRSTLTMLGIVFGVCSVIAMLAIGEGASQEAQAIIARLGSTNLIIETIRPPEQKADSGSQQRTHKYGLTYADAESLRNTIADIVVAVPVREIDQEARFHRKAPVKIIGTVPWHTETTPVRIVRGRFLSSIDTHRKQKVCVIDEQVARQLFLFDDPLGKDVRIQGGYYRVVGITATEDVTDSAGAMGNIYIPITTSKVNFTELTYSFSGGKGSLEKIELQKIIIKVDSAEQVLPMRDVVDALLSRLHTEQDYRIVVPLELLKQAAATRRIFSIVLGSIAAISLLVGGIGIMNIMLATVSERTREIGIRRALGARKRDIIIQFLSETLILTLAGGLLGIVLGSFIPFMVTYFGNMPTVITGFSLILSFGISGMIGITFGLYPAYRAANMDPIESLRHE
ncbi:MAG: ABC transporter permease [Planctomycetota bacterium]|jgi:putative ABC transport system permease protein